jgi:uncharacterized UPF0160 family protein
MQNPLTHVRIVGAGLIGTSIALALRSNGVGVTLTDSDNRAQSLAQDLMGDQNGESEGIEDLCIVATPPDAIARVIEEELGIKDQIIFAIYSSQANDFRVQTVPLNLGNFRFRKGLHVDWRGIEKEKLAQISGIEDINFCHTSGFIGGARTFESALKMADISLKQTCNN